MPRQRRSKYGAVWFIRTKQRIRPHFGVRKLTLLFQLRQQIQTGKTGIRVELNLSIVLFIQVFDLGEFHWRRRCLEFATSYAFLGILIHELILFVRLAVIDLIVQLVKWRL